MHKGIRQHGFWVLEEKIVKDHSQYSIKHAVDLKPPMISISSTSQDRTIFPSFIQPIWFYSVAMTLKFGEKKSTSGFKLIKICLVKEETMNCCSSSASPSRSVIKAALFYQNDGYIILEASINKNEKNGIKLGTSRSKRLEELVRINNNASSNKAVIAVEICRKSFKISTALRRNLLHEIALSAALSIHIKDGRSDLVLPQLRGSSAALFESFREWRDDEERYRKLFQCIEAYKLNYRSLHAMYRPNTDARRKTLVIKRFAMKCISQIKNQMTQNLFNSKSSSSFLSMNLPVVCIPEKLLGCPLNDLSLHLSANLMLTKKMLVNVEKSHKLPSFLNLDIERDKVMRFFSPFTLLRWKRKQTKAERRARKAFRTITFIWMLCHSLITLFRRVAILSRMLWPTVSSASLSSVCCTSIFSA
ncbi:unnamed protein product [Wuchereria bancrofti]|uniref:Uncharacterized protein n=1 Tax=Wuchereria bancrofti TaxID=6293 RepID=A0A3P7GIT7_WUCBA|nr:unnamed protein product [Wuchereria bancrofti]